MSKSLRTLLVQWGWQRARAASTAWVVLFVGTGLCAHGRGVATAPAGSAPATTQSKPAAGTLTFKGKFIQRLVLERSEETGITSLEFESPGASLSLPPGKYRWQEVHLDGGDSAGVFTSDNWSHWRDDWFTVTADKPAVLNVGGPLKPRLDVQRCGSFLSLRYELLGVGGEDYACSKYGNTPTFAISENGSAIASGSFEYG